VDVRWAAIIVTVVLACIGGLVAHILHDAKAHERIAKAEAEIDTLKGESEKTRDNVHKLRDSLPGMIKDLIDWFLRDRK
jgi:cell division protein FtsB